MAIDLSTLLTKLIVLTAAALVQDWLAAALKRIEEDTDLSMLKKSCMTHDLIEKAIEQVFRTESRLFFSPNRQLGEQVVNNVAVEAIHDFYLDTCQRMYVTGDLEDRGGIFTVYEDGGMGKSRAVLSLLLMKHGRAPKLGLWFGGSRTSFSSGDDYYNCLVNSVIGGGCQQLASLVDPTGLATMVLKLVPANLTDMDSRTCGVKKVPGLSAYLKRETEDKGYPRAGGIPVIVFEDVNVEGLAGNFVNRDMGRAHDFFDALMTQAFQSGKIVIVTTREEKVAWYFQGLNLGTKSKVIIRSEQAAQNVFSASRTFGWTNQTRIDFLMQRYGAEGFTSPVSELHQLARSEHNKRLLSNGLESLQISHLSIAPTSTSDHPAYNYDCSTHGCSLM